MRCYALTITYYNTKYRNEQTKKKKQAFKLSAQTFAIGIRFNFVRCFSFFTSVFFLYLTFVYGVFNALNDVRLTKNQNVTTMNKNLNRKVVDVSDKPKAAKEEQHKNR